MAGLCETGWLFDVSVEAAVTSFDPGSESRATVTALFPSALSQHSSLSPDRRSRMRDDFATLNHEGSLSLQPFGRSKHLDLQQRAIRLGHLQRDLLPLTPVRLGPALTFLIRDFRIVSQHSLTNLNLLNWSSLQVKLGSLHSRTSHRCLSLRNSRRLHVFGHPIGKPVPETNPGHQKQQTKECVQNNFHFSG